MPRKKQAQCRCFTCGRTRGTCVVVAARQRGSGGWAAERMRRACVPHARRTGLHAPMGQNEVGGWCVQARRVQSACSKQAFGRATLAAWRKAQAPRRRGAFRKGHCTSGVAADCSHSACGTQHRVGTKGTPPQHFAGAAQASCRRPECRGLRRACARRTPRGRHEGLTQAQEVRTHAECCRAAGAAPRGACSPPRGDTASAAG